MLRFDFQTMLSIKNLHVAYGEKKVLEGLDFTAKAGEITGIVGLNGSGKTTLLNTIYSEINPREGEVTFDNQLIVPNSIAYLKTQNFFYQRITGAEYLDLFRMQHPNFNVDEWNAVFRLPLEKWVDSYSTGMKKKLAFMGVLCLNRAVIILDEPFNGLDLETNETLKSILKILRSKQKTILVTSHILETLTTICDHIFYLNNGVMQHHFDANEYHQLEALLTKFEYDDLDRLVEGLDGGAS